MYFSRFGKQDSPQNDQPHFKMTRHIFCIKNLAADFRATKKKSKNPINPKSCGVPLLYEN